MIFQEQLRLIQFSQVVLSIVIFVCTMEPRYKWPFILSQCYPPEIKQINFYSENDRYFGQFLRDTCFNVSTICSKCQKPLSQHQIILLHNGFQLTISSSTVGNSRHQNDVIRTWRWVLWIIDKIVDVSVVRRRFLKLLAMKFCISLWELFFSSCFMIQQILLPVVISCFVIGYLLMK